MIEKKELFVYRTAQSDWFRALGLPADGKTPVAGAGPGGRLTGRRPAALAGLRPQRQGLLYSFTKSGLIMIPSFALSTKAN